MHAASTDSFDRGEYRVSGQYAMAAVSDSGRHL